MHATALARRAATLFIGSTLAACSQPAQRQEVEPVFLPSNVGERRLVGHDSAWVIVGRSYEVSSPIQAPLGAAQAALDDATREYRRYFDDDPPLVRVVIDTVAPPAPGVAGAPPGPGESRVERVSYSLSGNTRVVHLTTTSGPPRVADQQQPGRARGQFRTPPLPVAPAVVHAWLSSRADVAPSAANRPSTTATAPKAEPSAAMLAAATSSNDARIPDWIEVGLATLIVRGGSHDAYGAMLARQKLIPLDSLFHMNGSVLAMSGAVRGGREPMPGGEVGGMRGGRGGRGGRVGGGMMGRGGMGGGMGGASPRGMEQGAGGSLFALESAGFAAFVVEREGPAFLGRVADALMTGASVGESMRGARQLTSDTPTLQKAFDIWLSSFAPQMQGRGRR